MKKIFLISLFFFGCDLKMSSPLEENDQVVFVNFKGVVKELSLILDSVLVNEIFPGDTVIGSFSYSIFSTDSDTSDSTYGYYHQEIGKHKLEVQIGNARLSSASDIAPSIQILNDHIIGAYPNHPIDRFGVLSHKQSSFFPSTVSPPSFHILLADTSANIFSSDSLPKMIPSLEDFQTGGFAEAQISTLTGQTPRIFINIDIVTWEMINH